MPVLAPEYYYDPDGVLVGGRGFMMDMLELLVSELNITSQRGLSVDGKYGGKTMNGSFNGVVGMLTRNETDVFVAPLTLKKERAAVIDYTIPLFPSVPLTLWEPIGLPTPLAYSAYIDVFPPFVWLLISLYVLVLLPSAFYIISKSGVNQFHNPNFDSETFGLTNSYALSVLLIIQLGYDVVVRSLSARIIFLMAGLGSYVIFSYYEADLTAQTTIVGKGQEIKSFQDVMEKDYKVFVVDSTSNHITLKNAREGTAMHEVYYKTMHDNPNQLTKSTPDLLDKIYTQEKALLYSEQLGFVLGEWQRLRRLRIAEEIYSQVGWGIQQNSEYEELLNWWIHKKQESGVQKRLWEKWTYKALEKFWVEEPSALGFGNILFVFLWIAGGIIIALTVVICEFMTGKVMKGSAALQGNRQP